MKCGYGFSYSKHCFILTIACMPHCRWLKLCTANKQPKRLDVEAPIFPHIYMLTSFLRLPVFVLVLNAIDLTFKGQRFESPRWWTERNLCEINVIFSPSCRQLQRHKMTWSSDRVETADNINCCCSIVIYYCF